MMKPNPLAKMLRAVMPVPAQAPAQAPKPKPSQHPHKNLGGYLHPKKGK